MKITSSLPLVLYHSEVSCLGKNSLVMEFRQRCGQRYKQNILNSIIQKKLALVVRACDSCELPFLQKIKSIILFVSVP